jgi:hypothetical protein
MLEYVLSLLFLILLVRPIKMTSAVKAIELGVIVFITFKNPLLGILCAAIFIKQFPLEAMTTRVKTPHRMAIDEQIRPKDSNTMFVMKSTGLPPEIAHTGQISKPYIDNNTGKYTPF